MLYLLFYLIFKYLEPKKGCLALMALLLLINLALFFSPINRIYYGGNFCFGLGVILSVHYDAVMQRLRAWQWQLFALSLLLFGGGVYLFLKGGWESFLGDWLGRNLATIAVVLLLMLLLQNVCCRNAALSFLGQFYYEIYLVHIGVLSVAYALGLSLSNTSFALYALLAALSLGIAWLLHQCCNAIFKRLR